jgi:hypothetical protein
MRRIYRSPEAGEGGGLPASANPEAAGSAAAPEYLSKSDFESFRNEISGHLSRLSQPRQESRQEPQKKEGSSPSKRPSMSDYDWKNDPNALTKYEDDLDEWRYSSRKEKESKETAERTANEKKEATMKGHRARVAEYKKENPTFDDDLRKVGGVQTEAEVTEALLAHDNSAAIVHYLAKNPTLIDELNQAALTHGDRAVMYKVGAIAAKLEAEREAAKTNTQAASARPPRDNFRFTGAGQSSQSKDYASIFKKFRS